MAHSRDLVQPGAGNVRGGIASGFNRDQRIIDTVDHQCRRGYALQARPAITIVDDRAELPRGAFGEETAVIVAGDIGAQPLLAGGIGRAADCAGEERVREVAREFIHPFRLPRGGYRFENAFRYLIAQRL